MADLKNARSAARQAAEGTNETETKAKGKKAMEPSPREESSNTTQTQEDTAPAPVQDVTLVVIAPNPKRTGSIAYDFYAKYGDPCVKTTHRECRERGVRGKDISWDADTTRRHILLDKEAEAFLEIGDDREKRAEFLRGLGVKDAQLIKWGYMDAPKPAETETKPAEAETKEEVKA